MLIVRKGGVREGERERGKERDTEERRREGKLERRIFFLSNIAFFILDLLMCKMPC